MVYLVFVGVGRKDDGWNKLEKSNRGNKKMSTKQPRISKRSSSVGRDRERDDFDSPVRSQNSGKFGIH